MNASAILLLCYTFAGSWVGYGLPVGECAILPVFVKASFPFSFLISVFPNTKESWAVITANSRSLFWEGSTASFIPTMLAVGERAR